LVEYIKLDLTITFISKSFSPWILTLKVFFFQININDCNCMRTLLLSFEHWSFIKKLKWNTTSWIFLEIFMEVWPLFSAQTKWTNHNFALFYFFDTSLQIHLSAFYLWTKLTQKAQRWCNGCTVHPKFSG
jgi:hypothetical protein